MSTEIISTEDGYGFTLTRVAGPNGEERYQIDGGQQLECSDPFEPPYVILNSWQMIQLVAAFVNHLNKSVSGLATPSLGLDFLPQTELQRPSLLERVQLFCAQFRVW